MNWSEVSGICALVGAIVTALGCYGGLVTRLVRIEDKLDAHNGRLDRLELAKGA